MSHLSQSRQLMGVEIISNSSQPCLFTVFFSRLERQSMMGYYQPTQRCSQWSLPDQLTKRKTIFTGGVQTITQIAARLRPQFSSISICVRQTLQPVLVAFLADKSQKKPQ